MSSLHCARAFTKSRCAAPLHSTIRRTTRAGCGVHVRPPPKPEEEDRRRCGARRYSSGGNGGMVTAPGLRSYAMAYTRSPTVRRWAARGFGTTATTGFRERNKTGGGVAPSSPLPPPSSTTTTTSTAATSPPKDAVAQPPPSTLSLLFRKYGWTFVGSYFTLYIITLSTLFLLLDSSLIDPTTLTSAQFQLPWHSGTDAEEIEAAKDARLFRTTVAGWVDAVFERTKPYVEKNPHLSNLAVAWVATKFTEPVRLPVTVVLVPRIARWLGQVEEGEEKMK